MFLTCPRLWPSLWTDSSPHFVMTLILNRACTVLTRTCLSSSVSPHCGPHWALKLVSLRLESGPHNGLIWSCLWPESGPFNCLTLCLTKA